MPTLKDIDYKILFEMMKNSKISDRKLARKIGVSQPTITRRRSKLEKEIIASYTIIPKWSNLGYELLAVTLVKGKTSTLTNDKYDDVKQNAINWFNSHSNVIFAGASRGANADFLILSVHKNYAQYDKFIYSYKRERGEFIEDIDFVFVNLAGNEIIKDLNLNFLEKK
jgi:DNA-binding Lrp family transcriptional regulator